MRYFLKTLFIGSMTAGLSFIGIQQTQAATPPVQSTVRIEILNSTSLISFGSGTLIDADGNILTSYNTIRNLDKNRSFIARICVAKDELSVPVCNLRATLLGTNVGADLALLRVTGIQSGSNWLSPEEQVLKTGFKFTFTEWNKNATTTEDVHLGESLIGYSYPAIGNTTVSQTVLNISGFARITTQGKTVPNFFWVDKKFTIAQLGGGVFSNSGTLVGVMNNAKDPSGTLGSVTSLPVINSFLRAHLGNGYYDKNHRFTLLSPLNGVYTGTLPTQNCPPYASLEAGSISCRCNSGFFAVGNSCILGMNYCRAVFSPQSRYDDALQTCLCPNGASGEQLCRKTVPAPVPIIPVPPKTVSTSTPSTLPTHGTQIFCPAHASYNVKTWACACDPSWSKNVAGNACVFTATPTSVADLASCDVVGEKTSKRYFLKGNSTIRNFPLKNLQCFIDEKQAVSVKYRKG